MIAAIRTPAGRIVLALAVSVLVHAFALWLPKVQLPQTEILLPPLAAKLEPLPKLAAKPVAKPAAKSKRVRPPQPVVKPTNPVDEASLPSEPANPAPAESLPLPDVAAASAVEAQPATGESQAAHPLPKHAQLTFFVYNKQDHFQIGTINQQFEVSGDGYILKAATRTVGLVKLFKNYQLTQTSRGKIGKQGLQPETFEEEKINDSDKQDNKATFDWSSQKLRFSQGGETELPAGAQDMLSIFYQLSQLPVDREVIPLAVSNGKKLERYEFEVAPEEEIITPLGNVRAIHLRKRHAKGEGGLEIWLGLEYRLLPVKYLLIEPSGDVAGEIVISDIRVADE